MTANTIFIVYDTAGQPIAAIQPNTYNGPGGVQQSSDLSLFGIGYALWGQASDQNDFRLLENFACPQSILNPSPIQPMGIAELGIGNGINAPVVGQQWFNTTNQSMYVYTPNGWQILAIANIVVLAGTTSQHPASPVPGQLYFNTTTSILEVWTGTLVVPNNTWLSTASQYLPLAGGTMTGGINMGSQNITAVGAIESAAYTAPNGVTSNQITIPNSGATTLLDGPRIGPYIIYHTANLPSPASPFSTGMVMLWYGSEVSPPTGWLICNATNAALYPGNVPDMTDKYPIGVGTVASAPGVVVGSFTPTGLVLSTALGTITGSVDNTTLTISQMPTHTHEVWLANGTQAAGSGSHWADNSGGEYTATFTGGPNAGTQVLQNTGGSTPHTHTYSINAAHTHTVTGGSVIPPAVGFYFIIKYP